MKLKNLLQTKSIAFNIALIIYFFTVIGVAAQTANSPIFDAPWRGFDTGIIGNGFGPVSFAVGDLDGDADADALVGNSFLTPGIAVLKNRGDGTFDLPVRSALPEGETIGEVAVSDFDGDGDLDAFATIHGTNDELAKIVVWRNAGDGSFATAHVEFPTGQAPYGIWVADFTGDTFPDVVTANYGYLGSGNTVSLLRHNGQTGAAAAFLAPVNYAAGAAPLRLAAADVNGDNRLDLAVGHIQINPSTPVPVSILLNGGDGNFAAPFDYESAPGARQFTAAVTFGDLDNDGDADLIGGGLYPNGSIDNGAIIVRRNNGAGVFGNHEIYLFPDNVNRPQKLTIADITGDGFADILAAAPTGRATDGWVLLKSNGTGGFLPAVRYEAAQETIDVKAMDADRDGDLDVLTVAQSSAAITVHKNSGGGAFPVLTRYASGEFNDALESGDIDLDGDQDLVVTSTDIGLIQRTVRVLKNNGDGTFAPAVVYSTAPRFYGDMKLRDLNGDGNLDILLASHRQSTPYDFAVMLGSANGTFAAPVITSVNACAAGNIDAFDLDNDNDLDVVLTEQGGGCGGGFRIFIARNNGGAQFTITTVIQNSGSPSGIGGGDLNGDGKIDLVTSSQAIGVYLGNGNLTFQPVINSGTPPSRFKIADFNRDGKLDVGLIGSTGQPFGTERIGISLGNGNGTFAPANTQTGSSVAESLRNSNDIDAADVDRDGDLDLAVSNSASNDISIFLNNGNGSLQPHQRYGVGYSPSYTAAADFNGDGKIDLASSIGLPSAGLQNAVVVLRNISAQIPTPTPTPTAIPTPTPMPTPTVTPTPGTCVTFSNPAPITIPGATTAGPGAPYPSNITVAGVSGTVTSLTVTLNGLTHTFPDDIDILLVGPGGQSVILMSDTGGSFDITGVNLTFSDAAAAMLPDSEQIVSGTYQPTNFVVGDTFPAPAPAAGSYGSTLSVFNGTNPNGVYSLYIVDDLGTDLGSLSGGYSISINCLTPTPTPTPTGTPTATPTPTPTPTPTSTPTPTPTPTPMPGGIEADVAVRPNGDGAIQSDDVVQIRRFLNGTNTPDPATNEFQRADSAPFAEKGDGLLNSADVVQTRRYQNGTSPLQTAGGPMTAAGGRPEVAAEEVDKLEAQLKSSEEEPRQMRVEKIMTIIGETVTVNILVNAVGDEAEYGFTLNYDESVLSMPVIRAGNTKATVWMCNTKIGGAISCSVGGFAINNGSSIDAGIGEIASGENQILITVQLTVRAKAPLGETWLKLSNVNAASDALQLFTPRITNGTARIFGLREATNYLQ